jgi:hypothetical protein
VFRERCWARSPRLSNATSRTRPLTLLACAGAIVVCGCDGALQPGAPSDDAGGGAVGTGGANASDDGAAGAAGSSGPHVPGACIAPAADAALARFQTGVVGSWLGTATTPTGWTWSTATVEFTFFCDGHYHARCRAAEGLDPDSCVALYYGTDDDDDQKTYDIFDVRSDGRATADIVVVFDISNTTTFDRLDAIDLSVPGDRLTFDLIHLAQYGPVHYELQRMP